MIAVDDVVVTNKAEKSHFRHPLFPFSTHFKILCDLKLFCLNFAQLFNVYVGNLTIYDVVVVIGIKVMELGLKETSN